MPIKSKNADVVTGRAGLVPGRKWEISKNRYVQPYVKRGIIHEFTGDDRTIINADNVFKENISGTTVWESTGNSTIRLAFMANSNVRMATMSGHSGVPISA